jgi:hypothetical protein
VIRTAFATGLLPVLLLLTAGALRAGSPPPAREGDLIFQTSRSAQSLAVQKATASPYSHMGIVLLRHGRPHVFEAVSTVRYTPLDAWIRRGQGGRYVLKRLVRSETLLTPSALLRMKAAARAFEGRPYDLTFEWSDRRIYCSELVWKLYKQALGLEIGTLQRLRDFRLEDPAVRAKMKARYGSAVPLDEPVISPAAMFESSLLSTVAPR